MGTDYKTSLVFTSDEIENHNFKESNWFIFGASDKQLLGPVLKVSMRADSHWPNGILKSYRVRANLEMEIITHWEWSQV